MQLSVQRCHVETFENPKSLQLERICVFLGGGNIFIFILITFDIKPVFHFSSFSSLYYIPSNHDKNLPVFAFFTAKK